MEIILLSSRILFNLNPIPHKLSSPASQKMLQSQKWCSFSSSDSKFNTCQSLFCFHQTEINRLSLLPWAALSGRPRAGCCCLAPQSVWAVSLCHWLLSATSQSLVGGGRPSSRLQCGEAEVSLIWRKIYATQDRQPQQYRLIALLQIYLVIFSTDLLRNSVKHERKHMNCYDHHSG